MRSPGIAFALAISSLTALWVDHSLAAGPSSAEDSLAQAAQSRQYAFVLFYKDDNQAKATLIQTLQSGIRQHTGPATICAVSVQDPADKELVKRFGVSRAPLPVAIAVAPNGAITAILSLKATPAKVASAFVTECMADCMKAMQEGKIVLVCVKPPSGSPIPTAVEEFQADPEFKGRACLISVESSDQGEELFFRQMAIDQASITSPMVVFLAPPGVLVGKFGPKVTKSELVTALHAAGKCCDDPNCKHNPGPQAASTPKAKRN